MIKVENIEVHGFETAIRGMRNPLNSWAKSDSYYTHIEDTETLETANFEFFVGDNDLKLMQKLCKAGSDHRKFLRMINVTMDITAPLYWWAEYDTYKVGTVANSCSKMHKLLAKPFEMNDFSFDKLPGFKNEIKQFRPDVDEETEIWRKIDRDYDVSNHGRVRHGSRVLSGSVHLDNYILVTLHGKQHPIHRLVAEAFIPNPENKPFINHIDANKQNNSVENLEWCTQSENMKHACENNLQPKGLNTYCGKFTREQREDIKRLWDSGKCSKREIARKYGVSHTCVNDIINDKYKYADKVNLYEEVARPIVDMLNELRDSYIVCDNESDRKKIWYSILQLLPESYNQRRTVQLNYEVLLNMYHARKVHKLDEWVELCKVIETLPYFEDICLNNNDDA